MREIKLEDILRAEKFLRGKINKTPLLIFDSLNRSLGFDIYFKAEIFQKGGSFKIRGILNKLKTLSAIQKKKGVVAMSAGDHGISLAFVASQLRMPCVIILPDGAAKSKIKLIKNFGARVIFKKDNLWFHCLEMQRRYSLTPIHPFDDPLIIAGHGTIGLEILNDLPEVEMIFVPVGGGGLISGIAMAVKNKKPKVKIIGVEPKGAPTMFLSLRRNKLVRIKNCQTIADGLAARYVGENTWAIAREYLDGIVLVSDAEIIAAMKMILKHGKIVVEPSAAAAFAAVQFRKVKINYHSKIVCLLSGGNLEEKESLSILGYKKRSRKLLSKSCE